MSARLVTDRIPVCVHLVDVDLLRSPVRNLLEFLAVELVLRIEDQNVRRAIGPVDLYSDIRSLFEADAPKGSAAVAVAPLREEPRAGLAR